MNARTCSVRSDAEPPGARPSFGEEYEKWYPAVVRLCRRMLGEASDAESIAQEAFIRVWKAWPHFSGDRPFGPWVVTIARRLCFNEIAMRRRRERVATGAGWGAVVPVDDAFQQVSENHNVQRALLSLPPRLRRILLLRDFEGWAYPDIAQFEGVSLEGVRGALRRARTAFRAAYEEVAGKLVALPLLGAQCVQRWAARLARNADRIAGAVVHRAGGLESLAAAVVLLLGMAAAPSRAPAFEIGHEGIAAPGEA
ncbi:MAG: RNA polymerase sigma factor, partial [Actinomycetota bacterium]|nr:RNA polymerase sigma factor [Actinomycetota bacterium]